MVLNCKPTVYFVFLQVGLINVDRMKNNTIVDYQYVIDKKNFIYTEESCAVRATMKIIGGKWKIIIMHIINNESPARFGELKRKAEGITQSMLTSVLRELEDDGVLNRKIYAEIPPRVEYTLTALGLSLLPIVTAMAEWGLENKLKDKYQGLNKLAI